MNTKFYIPFFAINPHGADVSPEVMDAARAALETQLGGPGHVLAAKMAFEDAGGLHAYWRAIYPPAITRWTAAAFGAVNAAYRTEQPRQASIEDFELLNSAYVDVIAAARYEYTEAEWLNVFTAHFGMSDYCETHQEALTAGRRWLAIAPGACPIAAADQEIREHCQRGRPPAVAPDDEPATQAVQNIPRPTASDRRGAQACI